MIRSHGEKFKENFQVISRNFRKRKTQTCNVIIFCLIENERLNERK